MSFSGRSMQTRLQVSDGQFYLIILGLAVALTVAILAGVDLVLQRNFLTVACDTAVIQSAILNTLHGHWFSNNGPGGPNLLGSHTTFILLLVIPLYLVAPSVDSLFVLQVACVYFALIPLYLVAKELTGRPLTALIVAGAALVSPYLLHMALAPVHFETWVAAAALYSFYFYLRGNLPGFLGGMGVAVCCGEQAALIYIALGASLLLVDDSRVWRSRFGKISLLVGLTWILFAVFVVAPLGKGSGNFNIFAYNYVQWDVHSVRDIPVAILRNPSQALGEMLNPFRWWHLFSLLGLPLVFAFLTRRTALLLLPIPVYLLMSDQEFFLYFHAYYYTFAFMASYLGLIFFLGGRPPLDRVSLAVVFLTIFANIFILIPGAAYYLKLADGADWQLDDRLHEIFEQIPAEAGVYTPHRYSAYLSNREVMVIGDLGEPDEDFDAMMEKRFSETHVHAAQIDYIVSDFLTDQCGWRTGALNMDMLKIRSQNVTKLIDSGNWRLIAQEEQFALLQRVRK